MLARPKRKKQKQTHLTIRHQQKRYAFCLSITSETDNTKSDQADKSYLFTNIIRQEEERILLFGDVRSLQAVLF